MLFYDTETCGLHGPIVLIQYAYDDGPIKLYNVWKNPIEETLALIELFMDKINVGYNLAFDHFHLCQLYTTLKLMDPLDYPEDYIEEYAEAEAVAASEKGLNICLKPKDAIDLMLHARKGPYQTTMDRHDIKIKRVPTALATLLLKELNTRVQLDDIYFARRSDSSVRWQIQDIEGTVEFKNIILKFSPSSSLKAIACDALGIDVTKFSEVSLDKFWNPVEYGYAPFAKAVKKDAWPSKIVRHIHHWEYNQKAREYAYDDVKMTRDLYHHFGEPEPCIDSRLACCVGAVRWRGYKIDIDKIQKLKDTQAEIIKSTNYNFNAPAVVKKYLLDVMSPEEKIVLDQGTGAKVLESIERWTKDEVCERCEGQGCDHCDEGLIHLKEKHEAAIRASQVLSVRRANKRIELYDKLLKAGRFYASFKVIGTLSSRMSGADGLNPQGINREEEVRSAFPLVDDTDNYSLCGGDFDAFEVVVMDVAYPDPKLHKKLLEGKKIHGLFGVHCFPDMTYDEILATKGLPEAQDKYTRSKNGVFAVSYGGNWYTLVKRVGIPEEAAKESFKSWTQEYPDLERARQLVFDKFEAVSQPNGLGTKVIWQDPADYVESLFGTKRYFTLENKINKILFQLAQKPPKHWRNIKLRVQRRDREQTASGATQSALYAAVFALQGDIMRAAGNHVIQSTGAIVTKTLQARLWDIQPHGINKWLVQPMNIHDEVICVTHKSAIEKTKEVVKEFLDEFKKTIPLIHIPWDTNLKSWAGKS